MNLEGDYVLYWMVGARRSRYNFALDHAVDYAEGLGKPLLVFEPLRIDYPWASDRFHRFVIDGMVDNELAFSKTAVRYYPYIEPQPGHGSGLVEALAQRAAVVISDDAPYFFLPRMQAATADRLSVRLELVDGNGIYPLWATTRVFTTAASFRRHLQKEIPEHLLAAPRADPLARRKLVGRANVDRQIATRWSEANLGSIGDHDYVRVLPLDHSVRPTETPGGHGAAAKALEHFLHNRFDDYASLRNQPREDCQSHLSPYLHFGHISAHEVFARVLEHDDWSPGRLADRPTGSRTGWWGASPSAEAFLDQLVTWRELGYNMAAHHDDYTKFESLPGWAITTLDQHSSDVRPYVYSLDVLEAAETHDPLWNATQNQLVSEGTIHNYLRMLWGKKILEWSPTPRIALQVMIELNNKYALDGRDPNSYSGIFWVLGRYDRAWGPERPIFGKVRYMSSENTARKLKVRDYLERYRNAA